MMFSEEHADVMLLDFQKSKLNKPLVFVSLPALGFVLRLHKTDEGLTPVVVHSVCCWEACWPWHSHLTWASWSLVKASGLPLIPRALILFRGTNFL